MKIEEPQSLGDFLKIYGIYYSNGDNYYRGQADLLWEITPSIARNRAIKDTNFLLDVEKKLNEKFQQNIILNKLEFLIPKVNGCEDSWIMLMAAQHYGLPTRLLDFSHDKIIALLFAVADMQYLNKDGSLIIYKNPTDKQEDLSIFRNHFDNTHYKSFFIPAPILMNKENNEQRFSEIRKFLQGSKFLYRDTQNLWDCLTKDQEHTDQIIKIHISKELKLDIIKEIIKKGEMVYELFAGKNELDHFAAILKLEFSKLDKINIEDYLKSDNI